MTPPLIFIPNPKPDASLRLICFPYAGGNASTYMSWQYDLSDDVEFAVVQLPGRGVRFSEPLYQTMTDIVTALFLALEQLPVKPFLFYGHSMGARVAYELTLMLHQCHYRLPIHFIASGSVAPQVPRTKEKTHHLEDSEFIAKLAELDGSPAEVLSNSELMQLVLPALRADFKIIENYHSKSVVVLPTKVSVLMGDKEDVEVANIEAWFLLFEANAGICWIPGGHFFIATNRNTVLETVNNLISGYMDLVPS